MNELDVPVSYVDSFVETVLAEPIELQVFIADDLLV
jgi:hypothetical protein